MYESGFFWRRFEESGGDGPGWDLVAPSGRAAATVFEYKNPSGHVWFVWDEDGVGGENSLEPTIEQAEITAESAVLRWGKHFAAASGVVDDIRKELVEFEETLDDYESFMDNVDNQIAETLTKIGEHWQPGFGIAARIDDVCRLLEEIPAIRQEIEKKRLMDKAQEDEPRLIHCPFCGESYNLEVRPFDIEDREGTPTRVYCEECGCEGPWEYERDGSQKCVDLWNARVH